MTPNSVSHGAIRREATTPMLKPKTTRATRPDGTVFGSVIMKKRKMKISGEVMMIHQKWAPPIGVNDQRVVIVWPSAARMPMPTARVIQKVRPMASRCRRPQMNRPPAKITT